jgi:predicted DCC family thiol-disulfide oxidoreductase YuxK
LNRPCETALVTNGWTGGQYSLVRALTGAGALVGIAVAASQTASGLRASALAAAGLLASGSLALGRFSRTAAVATAIVWLLARRSDAWGVDIAAIAVFAVHAAMARAPYGSLDARGRLDPGGDWAMHPWRLALAASTFLGVLVLFAWTAAAEFANPWRWAGSIAALLLVSIDPAWIPGLSKGTTDTLFYDGNCGLCHGAVRFALAEDPDGTALRFAPLDSDAFREKVPADVRASLPDSLVVATADGRILTRAAGVLHLGRRLGGMWRALATIAGVVPTRLLDAAYDVVARLRHRLFAKPKDACPLLPPHLRARFRA